MNKPLHKALLPGSVVNGQPATLGVMGGGQLGRMFVHAAQALGYRCIVLDPDAISPAGAVAEQHIQAGYLDSLGLAEAQAYHPLFMQWGNGAWNTVQMFVRDGRFNFPNDDLSGLTAMQQLSLFVDVRDRNFGIVFPGS